MNNVIKQYNLWCPSLCLFVFREHVTEKTAREYSLSRRFCWGNHTYASDYLILVKIKPQFPPEDIYSLRELKNWYRQNAEDGKVPLNWKSWPAVIPKRSIMEKVARYGKV